MLMDTQLPAIRGRAKSPLAARNRKPGHQGGRASQCATAMVGGEPSGPLYYRAARSSRVDRRSRTCGSCYSSPHVQSQLVTDHLHFCEADITNGCGSMPCQAVAGELRGRLSVTARSATRVAAGTPALVFPST